MGNGTRVYVFTADSERRVASKSWAANDASSKCPTQLQYTHGVTCVLNTGRIPATEVEVTFNWQPPNYNIWPVRPHETHTSPDSRFTLKFANLAPKEQFLVEQISPQPLPQIMSVRCKECVGKAINMRPTVVFPSWLIALLWGLIFLGTTSVIYLLLKVGSLFIQ